MAENEIGSQLSHQLSLEALPTELVLRIIGELTDLDALFNLIRASPVASRIFDHYAHEIMDAVLPMCPLKIEIQHLVRAVILTRSSALPVNNLHEFKLLFEEQPLYLSDGCRCPPLTLPSDSLNAASSESIRSGLATACRISALTNTCLGFNLGRLHDKSICNPYHYGTREYPLQIFLGGRNASRKGLMEMQLVGEVQKLAIRDPDGLGWPLEDIEEAARFKPEGFVTNHNHYFDGMEEEAKTVCEYLQQLRGEDDEDGEPSQRSPIDYYRLPRPPAIKARTWITEMPKPTMRKTQFGNVYDLGNRLIPADPPIQSLELLVKDRPPERLGIHKSPFRGQDPIDADTTGLGIDRYIDFAFRSAESPLPDVPFDVFRRLGFALWDDARMRAMRFVGKYDGGRFTAAQFFVWRSLLPEEEIAEAAARIKARPSYAE
ncbi:hypothetical protein TGAM01_v204076 [Trichoderma gamsii]|uniref:F-box domain-containing protein n=1 Tax=Trichoderma gamsii TaxID=398673 RepID=A0A2P4ZS54_9HYPO|nr:hypothetical protein TGAM01_v204076 [Trichoderma gamsii]PON27127.1 hypothetical protein TGAM01_v204076 [Trichoderma gamsii]